MIHENGKAPDFMAIDQNGITQSLSLYVGRWIVLYFYPKDDTPGCTKEACSFRDSFGELEKVGVVILGVSKDTVETHKKFAEKYHLNFPLLADPGKHIIRVYDAWGKKKFMGREFEGTLRITFLIDPSGVIRKIYKKVNPLVHVGEILKDLKQQ
jgi:peroxiredoxin Q/BCP